MPLAAASTNDGIAPTYVIPDLVRNHKQGSKKPGIAEQLIAWYRDNAPADGAFGIIVKNGGLLRSIVAYENERKDARHSAGHPHTRIFDIEPLPGLIHHMRLSPERVKQGRKWAVRYGMMLGTFRVRVTDALPIFIITWGLNAKDTSEMAIGSQKAFDVLYERLETKRRRLVMNAPPKGIWTLEYLHQPQGRPSLPHFVRRKSDIENMLRFNSHPMYDSVERDMNAFFENIAWWTRYGQPGMRKVLMAGPPGTGKTSIAMAVAATYHDRFLILYVNDSQDIICAAELAAAKSRPTIIVAEEVDMFFRPDSYVLNWLDGSSTPRNPAGTYLISTTNYPRKIDPRILKRPGRIDSVFRVGALRSKDSGRIAAEYLGDDAADLDIKTLGRTLDRTTPAEIREIINLSLRSLLPGQTLTVDTIAMVRTSLKRSLAGVENLADDDPDQREADHERLGPIDDDYDAA